MKKVNVGLIGFGTVGAGVAKILKEKKSFLSERIGLEINLKWVCDKDLTTKRGVNVDKNILTSDARQVINDPQVDIVVELIGGIRPAADFITESLKNGKHVVTANKALLAHEGPRLFALAEDKGRSIYFESSVGAGIPIIKSLREGLVANKFTSVYGIVNGTSNYILSRMTSQNMSFAAALKEAQARGFAESDPTLDIQGTDSAHKLAVLTYLCFGKFIPLDGIYVEGISRVTQSDILYASEMGFRVKLLAIAKRERDELEVRVHPTLIPRSHLLASVDGVNNAIYVSSDLAGDLLFYGPGAGALAAASGVVSDIVDLTQDIKAGMFRPTLNIIEDKAVRKLRPCDEFVSKYYLRFQALDKPGVLAKIAGILAKCDISIASVSQKERRTRHEVPVVMTLHEAKEKNMSAAVKAMAKLDVVREPLAIRIEEL
jgi:homoserine dehydrogenase